MNSGDYKFAKRLKALDDPATYVDPHLKVANIRKTVKDNLHKAHVFRAIKYNIRPRELHFKYRPGSIQKKLRFNRF